MNYGVDLCGLGFRTTNPGGQHRLDQTTVFVVDLRPNECRETAPYLRVLANEPLGFVIAIKNRQTAGGQQPANVAFAAPYAAGDGKAMRVSRLRHGVRDWLFR